MHYCKREILMKIIIGVAILYLIYFTLNSEEIIDEKLQEEIRISQCENNLNNIINLNIDFEYKNKKLSKNNIKEFCIENNEKKIKGKSTFSDGEEIEFVKNIKVSNFLYNMDIYTFDKCLFSNSYLPLKKDIRYKVEYPKPPEYDSLGYNVRGFDRAGFDRAGYDRVDINTVEIKKEEFKFNEIKKNNITLMISTNPKKLYVEEHTTYKIECEEETSEEYEYPENIEEMTLMKWKNQYLLRVKSKIIK
jgi:hypothetical protein